ncbi:MAG TPA: hypothetical protein VFE98_06280 [Candidatus Bathyarchaeia archaeon]|nr:hypothetical protein [Candidatus Bathyarchaeia archaeon]
MTALVLPLVGLWRLLRKDGSMFGIRTGNLARVNIYFIIAVLFDIVRVLGYNLAAYAITICIYLIFANIGVHSSIMYFYPECRSFKESITKLRTRMSFLTYEFIVLGWIILYIAVPVVLVPSTLVTLATVIVYPTSLFVYAKKRAKPVHIKNVMSILSVSWFSFVTVATFLFALGTQPPILGFSVPYAWEFALITGSGMVFLMSIAIADPIGSSRLWTGQMMPQTIVKSGHRYLILHDAGRRITSFLSSTLRSLIESGARITIKTTEAGSLGRVLYNIEPQLGEWTKSGKVVFENSPEDLGTAREGLGERLSLAPTLHVRISELRRNDLQETMTPREIENREGKPSTAELYLLENTNAPRPQLNDFLHRNSDIEFVNLSESNDAFSASINMSHEKTRGSSMLLEYDTNTDYEGVVDRFLSEGIINAELCVLFTTKSSKLYRTIKGKKTIKLVAASSLVSAPDELPDGEVQIPDKELGLVTSIVSDYVENSKEIGANFVFDSITELIRGERWEQIYAGIKQLNELLNMPNVTALFLANRNTTEPRFLGALHGEFSLLLRLDDNGLQRIKPVTR